MNFDEFEEAINAELKNYEEIYSEYNASLEKALSLIEIIRDRFKNSQK